MDGPRSIWTAKIRVDKLLNKGKRGHKVRRDRMVGYLGGVWVNMIKTHCMEFFKKKLGTVGEMDKR